ncbi:manganese efflux pump [bacterium]|nr:manganese efflux pump [bacterium]
MNLTEIIFLSIAMGIDCLVVSFSQGLIFTSHRRKNSLLLALTMGLFQGLMPCIGYLGAYTIKTYIEPFSKFIVFGIFMILGMKFISEALSKEDKPEICCIGLKCLMLMGLATSIDALAAGGSFVFSGNTLLIPALMIGIFSFFMSLAGFWFGNFLKKFPSKYFEVSGGLILIVLALKALLR